MKTLKVTKTQQTIRNYNQETNDVSASSASHNETSAVLRVAASVLQWFLWLKVTCCHYQDVCQGLEQLKGPLLLLSSAARRLSDKEEAVRTVTQLNTSYELDLQEAKDKQSALENLLSLWQKYESTPNIQTSYMKTCF